MKSEHTRKIPISDKHLANKVLERILMEEHFLFQKTLYYHWNITGFNFISIHKLLEDHYEWLKLTVDDVAERIRALGYITPLKFEFPDKGIKPTSQDMEQTAREMIEDLTASHGEVISSLKNAIANLSETDDYATEDLLIKILGEHEKNAWMLRSHLEG